MKAQLVTYKYGGFSVQVYPETETEERLLRMVWEHGTMYTGHPCKDKECSGYSADTGFYINSNMSLDKDTSEGT